MDNVGRDAVISHGKYEFRYMRMSAEVTGPMVVMDAFPLCALSMPIPASSSLFLSLSDTRGLHHACEPFSEILNGSADLSSQKREEKESAVGKGK